VVGDEAQLYRSLAGRLETIVRHQVRAPREVVEDACHHAWTKLINHSERIERGAALTWLVRTALREAWRLERREHRDLSLEAETELAGRLPPASRAPGPAEHAELRDRLASLDALPERQRRLLWLRAAGLSYIEMSAYTGDSLRTVERQISRATQRMRGLSEQRTPALDDLRHVPSPIETRRVSDRTRSSSERGIER
jgi:RNA polymerase sigma factor (sigma-70 family)